jgi:hypothetical protein
MSSSAMFKILTIVVIALTTLLAVSAAPQDASNQFNYSPELSSNDAQIEPKEGEGVKVDERINWEGLVHGVKIMADGFNKAWAAIQERGAFGEEGDNNQVQTPNDNQKTD